MCVLYFSSNFAFSNVYVPLRTETPLVVVVKLSFPAFSLHTCVKVLVIHQNMYLKSILSSQETYIATHTHTHIHTDKQPPQTTK